MYLSRCLQNWMVAERSGVCTVPDVMKLHLLKKGAHLTDTQIDQYHTMTIDKPWDLQWAIRVFHAIDLSASEQTGSSRKTQVYMVDEGSSFHGADTCCYQCNQCDEPEDVSDVLVNLADFNDFAGADDKYCMIDDDF